MKKSFWLALIIVLSLSLFGCTSGGNVTQPNTEPPQNNQQPSNENTKDTVARLVKDFGSRLQAVPLQASKDIVTKSMQEKYSGLVSPTLLAQWQNDPLKAPGRLVSSPWPDRIQILTIKQTSEKAFEVKGQIIEITSTEKTSGGYAARRPINLVVEKIDNHWLINAVTLGEYESNSSVVYKNTQYGFSFALLDSWKGYSIVTDQWEGYPQSQQGNTAVATGPLLSIRHPQWTNEKPRQDFPILIFTISQWISLQQEEFHIGAAPIGPRELGRNNKYVFALPARYNFAFPTGFEEVENILAGEPLQSFTPEQ